jgi:SusD family.
MRIGGTEVLPPVFTEANTGYQFSKYVMDCTLEGVDRVTRSYNDMPVFRYAEVLLTYAEAKAELGTLTQDDLDKSVNLIRSRAGMPDMTLSGLTVDPYLTSPEFGYTNPALLADAHCAEIVEIRRERSIELALEGRRWNDLMRWGEGKCIEQPIYGMYFPVPEYIYDKDGKHYEYGEYDLDGDGVKEYCLWSGTKPSTKAKYVLKVGFGGDIVLTEGNHGNVIKQVVEDKGSALGFKEIARSFNGKRDYLYPLPQEDLALNESLKQNPGWN